MNNTRTVSTILLNRNNAADTIGCLRSLRYLRGVQREAIVVDNGSTDDSVACIRAAVAHFGFPVTVLEIGSNVGIRHALKQGADYLWLLNTDAIPHPNALRSLAEVMEQDAQVGAVGLGECYCVYNS